MYSRKMKTLLIIALTVVLCSFLYVQAETSGAYEKEEYITKTSPISSGTIEALSNRHVHPFEDKKSESTFETREFAKVTESEEVELWLNQEWNTLRIKNKSTGYLWGGLPLEEAEGLNKTWNNYGNSLVAITCFDESGVEKRYSLTSDAEVSYTIGESGFAFHANFLEIGISFDTIVELNGDKLTFSVDENSITEGADDQTFSLASMSFLPFLGSSYSDTLDGYMLIPDGSGALIRFQKPAQYTSTYAAKIYGKDLGIESLSEPSDLNAYRSNDYLVEEPQVLMPIYGIVHGAYQNGLFSVVDSGAHYTSIVATPAILNNPYNWVTARFEFRQKYIKNINRKEGAGAVVPQEHRNEISPKLSIYVLNGVDAHYDGMAVFYRNMLKESEQLKKVDIENKELPLRMEVLGADYHDEFIGRTLRLFTSAEDATSMVRRLSEYGISNLSLVYKCYTKKNEAGKALLSKVGDAKDFENLKNLVTESGGEFYYYLNPLGANYHQITFRTEAANNLSNMVIKLSRRNSALMYKDTYFYRLSEVQERIEEALSRKEYGDNPRFAVDQLSYRLFGDFTSGKEKTREENLDTIIDLVNMVAGEESTPLYKPNQYMWKYTSEFYDTPLCGGQFLYETDTVPFLQIVLSGSIPMFGQPLNTGSYSRERILRHIEYGVAPSFVVTGCDSFDLYKTGQEDYFSTNFSDWEGYIQESYDVISEALQLVLGQAINEHVALEDGFIRVTYENGVKIYINYTDTLKSDGSIEVEANNYRIVQ